MGGQDADKLMSLLGRLVAACERLAIRSEAETSGGGGRGRQPARLPECSAFSETCDPAVGEGLQLPAEVGTARAAEILGVSKDTVIEYKRKGLLPFRDLAPPGSTKPVYMFPLDAVVRLRTTYQTEEPAPAVPHEPSRRVAKGRRQFKHLIIDEA